MCSMLIQHQLFALITQVFPRSITYTELHANMLTGKHAFISVQKRFNYDPITESAIHIPADNTPILHPHHCCLS